MKTRLTENEYLALKRLIELDVDEEIITKLSCASEKEAKMYIEAIKKYLAYLEKNKDEKVDTIKIK